MYQIIFVIFKNYEEIKLNFIYNKDIISNKVKPINITRKLKISKQSVNYWSKTPIKSSQKRRKKSN